MADGTYQPKIYRKQKHSGQVDEMVVAAGGKINLEAATSEFGFLGEDFTATQMKGLSRNTCGAFTVTNLSTGSTVLSDMGGSSPPVIPSTYNVVKLSCTSTMVAGSARMFSAEIGRIFTIRYTTLGEQSNVLSIYFSGNASGISGVRILASTGSDLSCILIRSSAASFAKLTMRGEESGVWAIIAASGQVTEQSA